jgi:transcriptional regulator with XRE-family HTH domain
MNGLERMLLGADMRTWRLSKGLSQRRLAAIMGMRKSRHLNSIEKGLVEPTAEMLARIVEAIDGYDGGADTGGLPHGEHHGLVDVCSGTGGSAVDAERLRHLRTA